jgi:hypothetical protein
MDTKYLKTFAFAILVGLAASTRAQVNLTYHYDNVRDSLDTNETALTLCAT